MANKTLYVRDGDLALWELAQVQLGQSISALFSEFLREKVKMLRLFVHVLRCAPDSQNLAVMFSPVGPMRSGGPGGPHYVEEEKLIAFLERSGIGVGLATKIAADLKIAQSVSELTTVTKRRSAMSECFQARTQYGDWKGTVAADESDGDRFYKLFEATGNVDPDKEILIGFEFYQVEDFFHCAGFFHSLPAEHDRGYYPALNAKFQMEDLGSIQVKKVRVALTREEFFKYFKRFNMVLVNGALDIIGREYEAIASSE